MPELPEVQTVVNSLAPKLVERTIRRVTLFRADIVTPAEIDLAGKLTNRKIKSIERRGKRIVFALDDGNRFYIHLGMSGRLTIESPEIAPAKHTHLIFEFDKSEQQLRFRDARRFGGVFWIGNQNGDDSIGPEPLQLTPSELFAKLRSTSRAIKTALLDQKLIAGLGNIYADEALFEARVNPRMRAKKISDEQARRLNGAIKRVLKRAIKHRGSSLRDYVDADGTRGAFQKLHRVYGREGEGCIRCDQKIKRIVLGGRSTHFCPACQGKAVTAARRPSGSRSRASAAPRG